MVVGILVAGLRCGCASKWIPLTSVLPNPSGGDGWNSSDVLPLRGCRISSPLSVRFDYLLRRLQVKFVGEFRAESPRALKVEVLQRAKFIFERISTCCQQVMTSTSIW